MCGKVHMAIYSRTLVILLERVGTRFRGNGNPVLEQIPKEIPPRFENGHNNVAYWNSSFQSFAQSTITQETENFYSLFVSPIFILKSRHLGDYLSNFLDFFGNSFNALNF